MYYREEVIDGVLCFKESSAMHWTPYTPEKLTRKILKLQVEVSLLQNRIKNSYKVHEKI